MEESRTQKLQALLRRLGKAVHGSVVRSDEVRACLDELHDEGWHAVMLLETSLACGENGSVEVDKGILRMHIGTNDAAGPEYRLDEHENSRTFRSDRDGRRGLPWQSRHDRRRRERRRCAVPLVTGNLSGSPSLTE